MTKCADIHEMVSLYIDGQLDENERKQFEEHINNCESCSVEYEDILNIIKLCAEIEEEELPDGFGSELHQKLLEVSGKHQTTAGKLILLFRSSYFRVATSVAAALLLIFLVKGVYNTGVLNNTNGDVSMIASQKSMESAPESFSVASAAAEPSEENSVMAYDSGAVVTAGGTELYGGTDAIADGNAADTRSGAESGAGTSSKAAGESAYTYSTPVTPSCDGQDPVQPVETDRATEDERVQQPMMAMMAAPETVNSRLAQFQLTLGDPDVQMVRIRELVAACDGMENPVFENVPAVSIPAGASVTYYLIPNERYDEFKDSVSEYIGAGNITVDPPVVTDQTAVLEELISSNNELDNRILKLEEEDAAKNSAEIVILKEQITANNNIIESLRLGSEYTNVRMIIIPK